MYCGNIITQTSSHFKEKYSLKRYTLYISGHKCQKRSTTGYIFKTTLKFKRNLALPFNTVKCLQMKQGLINF